MDRAESDALTQPLRQKSAATLPGQGITNERSGGRRAWMTADEALSGCSGAALRESWPGGFR
jgi:hypothetical protein